MIRLHLPFLVRVNQAKRQSRGFTLLELLVVISILGILMSMGAVAFTTAQRKSRDSKRQADLKVIQNGFEQFYADNAGYDATSCANMFTATYFPAGQPLDPQTDAAYSCGTSASAYCVCATLEDPGSGNSDGRTGTGCDYNPGGDLYCVSNLQ